MADTERVIIVNPEQQARQQLVEDMKRLRDNPLDKTVPGGVFKDATGDGYHNANGDPVTKDGKPVGKEKAAASEPAATSKKK